jgi:SAM-dependent methyltransferase
MAALRGLDRSGQQFDVFDNYPGWAKAPAFLKQMIVDLRATSVADIGGGANPMLDRDFVKQSGIEYSLLDISQEELDKAPDYYRKFRVDLTVDRKDFNASVREESFDFIFSHFFLEHVPNSLRVHENICSSLRPGGVAVHFFPCPRSLPLFTNRILPESVTQMMVRIAQPERDLAGKQGKFPAYYNRCEGPSTSMHAALREIGFDVIRHTGFVGHNYYRRIPGLRQTERALRPIFAKWKLPLISYVLLVLQKRREPARGI